MEKITYPKEVLEKMQEIVDNCMGDAPPYCEATCPMHTDVKGYVNLISEGKYEEAIKLIREKLFIPATLGRICAHPCEEKCKREEAFRQPMAIAALKRFVADNYDNENLWQLDTEDEKNKKVAVIGAGPAGAQAALDLRRKGYKVTIYERLPVVGGMMRVGIPEYRLPRNIIDFEYSLLEKLGVEFKLGVEVGKDISFDQLRKEHDAVIIAVGAHKGVIIPVPGHDLEGVHHAVEFLREVSLTRKFNIGKKIAVIGGGNVAIDVARSARRVGAEEVHLICLEDKENMPAHDWEVEEAEEEGVTVHDSFGTNQIIGKDGKVSGIEIKKCTSIFDKDGNFNPQYDENNKKLLDVDNVIFAVGQGVDNSFVAEGQLETQRGGRFKVDPVTLQTKIDNVFVAGDASGRSVIAIEAMAEGRKAATSVDRFLKGEDMYKDREFEGTYETWLEKDVEGEEDLPRVETRKVDPKERVKSFTEVDLGFTEEQAKEEASRCLQCECKLCMKECEMLNDFCECPKDLFEEILETGEINPKIPYSCNMCSQCTLECPKDFPIKARFMDIRKEMIKANNGKSPMKGHNAIEVHQALGYSKLFNITKAANKSGKAKRVFIPGCSLPSYNPEAVGKVLEYLQKKMPGTGAILKCCGKPTKALGQVDKFKERYAQLQAEIDRLGAEEIIVACQSCYLTISEYSPNQRVRSLWEVLPEIGLPEEVRGIGKDSDIVFAVHDSCSTRDRKEIHDGIRWIINELGYKYEEPPHTKENTRCCGFGGMVVPANPELALRVMKRRTAEVKSDYMVAYCAACRESMVKGGKKALHILDLIFGGPWNSKSEFPGVPSSPVKSWVNRYKSKRAIKKV
ncbi:FAD-dependent oxidoreductase [Thermohalobacter berrensis]|uniref:Pyridine nucleotide-disulfide oxidoreductase n=1 Tax=Thermohalobacter berrensis TaxID=99594 RepID=A0A419SUX6_9FIRM|nr:FAD-dependent oxidoreductase [Thermohalobacter berrensis]RKD29021.1 pyridine nucleotide-disulfide oxidoreductase [Thermohalobacter berrensis]